MDSDIDAEPEAAPADPAHSRAVEEIRRFFQSHREQVFYSRQIEVLFERHFFHWISNRAIHHLLEEGALKEEWRPLGESANMHLFWHRSFRYPRRAAARLVDLVEEFSSPNTSAALGTHAELLVLEGFALLEFVLKGRHKRSFGDRVWERTGHDLDFIFSRDHRHYGVEVKNMLGYMEKAEFEEKIKLCKHLGLQPVFVVRMLPKTWIEELRRAGGFALILGHQLYPWSHRDLALRIRQELGLPVDSPRSLAEGTMQRFLRWHERQL